MPEYLSIKENITNEIIIKKSRFIANIIRVNSEEEAIEQLQRIKKEHYKATHNCSAFIIGENNEIKRMSDDGEPQGTAGVPMLNVLENKKLTYVLAVVTRYFGGIKLGAGGLVRAYSNAVSEAISDDLIVQAVVLQGIQFRIPYNLNDKFLYTLEQNKITISSIKYSELVDIIIHIENSTVDQVIDDLVNQFNGKLEIKKLDKEIREIPLSK